MNVELPNKTLDRRLNFGCGTLLGFVLALLPALNIHSSDPATALLVSCAIALLCGLLTLRFGEKVLDRIIQWLLWLWR